MKKIYLVTEGEYDYYRILGTYSTIELAQEAHDAFGSRNEIEEMGVDIIPEHPPGLFLYYVAMGRLTGNTVVRLYASSLFDDEKSKPVYVGRNDRGDYWFNCNHDTTNKYRHRSESFGCFWVWAKNKEHAVEIVAEKRTILIATDEWPVD